MPHLAPEKDALQQLTSLTAVSERINLQECSATASNEVHPCPNDLSPRPEGQADTGDGERSSRQCVHLSGSLNGSSMVTYRPPALLHPQLPPAKKCIVSLCRLECAFYSGTKTSPERADWLLVLYSLIRPTPALWRRREPAYAKRVHNKRASAALPCSSPERQRSPACLCVLCGAPRI